VLDGVKRVPHPVLPISIRPSIVIRIRDGAEPWLRFAGGEGRERCGLEQLADEFGAGYLDVEIDVYIEVVDVDLWFDKCVGGGNLDGPPAEREKGPEVNADRIWIPSVIEEFDHRS